MLFYGHTMRSSFIPQQTDKSASVRVRLAGTKSWCFFKLKLAVEFANHRVVSEMSRSRK